MILRAQKFRYEKVKNSLPKDELNGEMGVFQKQPSRAVLRKKCSENMQQIYRRAPMSKCDFSKVTKQVIVSAHAPVEITKPYKLGLGDTVLEAGVCFGV